MRGVDELSEIDGFVWRVWWFIGFYVGGSSLLLLTRRLLMDCELIRLRTRSV